MGQIDDKLISYLEDLSCLTLSQAEKSRLAFDLQKIVGYIAKLGELDTEGAGVYPGAGNNADVFRDDIVQPSFDRGLILKNAPMKTDEMIIAPGILER